MPCWFGFMYVGNKKTTNDDDDDDETLSLILVL